MACSVTPSVKVSRRYDELTSVTLHAWIHAYLPVGIAELYAHSYFICFSLEVALCSPSGDTLPSRYFTRPKGGQSSLSPEYLRQLVNSRMARV